LNRRAAAYYAAGVIILLAGAFSGRDFSDPADVMEGVVFLVSFMFIMLFMYWLEKQGLIPWWGWGKNTQYRCNKWNDDANFHGIYAVNDITRRSGMFNSESIKGE
jgi:asparagine N-glycosylation enzyme membrane subunit Stt3